MLEEATRCGLLRSLGSRVYQLHPTLPVFLRRQLVAAIGEDGLSRLDFEFLKLYAAIAAHYFEAARKADPNAIARLGIEEANLLRALRLAEKSDQWNMAQSIVQTIGEFYEITSRLDEWKALRTGLLNYVGREMSTGADRNRASLWMFLIGTDAEYALRLGDLSNAELAYQQGLNYLVSLNEPSVEPNIAVAYIQLGLIAQERQQFDLAEQWYKKTLEIRERLGPERELALSHHRLGMIAEERQQFDLAEQWYEKALAIFERLGLERDTAMDYHQLGIVAYLRQQFDLAEQRYKKALAIYEGLGLERDTAGEYHQLGLIAEKRQQIDLAEQWYKKALEIYERLGLERDAADDYHQLGIIAQERQQFDLAEQWYEKALAIFERLGHPPLMVNTLAQLGVLSRKQERWQESVTWFGKALAIAAEYQMRVAGQILFNLARVMKIIGENEFVVVWQQAFSDVEPPLDALREAAKQLEE